jgi:hypothetical protein
VASPEQRNQSAPVQEIVHQIIDGDEARSDLLPGLLVGREQDGGEGHTEQLFANPVNVSQRLKELSCGCKVGSSILNRAPRQAPVDPFEKGTIGHVPHEQMQGVGGLV